LADAATILLVVGAYLGIRMRSRPAQRDMGAIGAVGVAGTVWLVGVSLVLGAQRLAEGDSIQIPLVQAYLPGLMMVLIAVLTTLFDMGEQSRQPSGSAEPV
jgi:hypothetical protein